jgi:hypothetical protein
MAPHSRDIGPARLHLSEKNAATYRKAKTVFAYRSKDPIVIEKEWVGYVSVYNFFRHFVLS